MSSSPGIGADSGNGNPKNLNVELNIVPFIDLMSCLTAFLLASAVWVNLAQIQTTSVGRSFHEQRPVEEAPELSVLIRSDRVEVGTSRFSDHFSIAHHEGQPDWDRLKSVLAEFKQTPAFIQREEIEIATDPAAGVPITYQQLVSAMDVAVLQGFPQVKISDSRALSATF
jgi:biopolymer transport protein TolR